MHLADISKYTHASLDMTERRRKLMLIIIALGFIGNLIMAIIQLVTLGPAAYIGMLVCIVLTVSSLVGFVFVYRRYRVTTTARTLLSIWALALFTEVSLSGGLPGYFSHSLIIVPMTAALVLGSKDTIIFSGLTLIVMFGLATFHESLPPFVMDEATFREAASLTGIFTVVGMALSAVLLVRETERVDGVMRRLIEQQAYLAMHDTLTGLANRTAVNAFLKKLDPAKDKVELFLIDLDGFKQVNDQLGHAAGDDVLVKVALQLRALCKSDWLVARLGGDEFLVLAKTNVTTATSLGSDIATLLRQTIQSEDGQILVSASVGSASFPDDASTPSELLSKADTALYAAKKAGKRRHAQYGDHLKDAHKLSSSLGAACNRPRTSADLVEAPLSKAV